MKKSSNSFLDLPGAKPEKAPGAPSLLRFLRKAAEAFHAAGFLAFGFADPVASSAVSVAGIGMLRLRRGTSSSRLRSA